jgi:hypothetical protein
MISTTASANVRQLVQIKIHPKNGLNTLLVGVSVLISSSLSAILRLSSLMRLSAGVNASLCYVFQIWNRIRIVACADANHRPVRKARFGAILDADV